MIAARIDLGDQVQQARFLTRNRLPIVIHKRIKDLPARSVVVHQLAHRVDDLEPCLRGRTAAGRKCDVPPQRVAGDSADIVALRCDLSIQITTGVDERRRIIARRVAGA